MEKIIRRLKISLLVTMILSIFIATGVFSQEINRYQTYDEMTKTLKNLVHVNKDIARMESIGKTLQDRDIWLITIANDRGDPVNERPGLFIGANYEGDHVVGSQIALSIIDYLLKNYQTNAAVQKSIDESVYYIIPRVNPDAAELMFANVKSYRKTNSRAYDGDNDGRIDEDGPDDLNKDGIITVMRVKDESGSYMPDPDDPRLMKKAAPSKGESGEYALLWEGLDNDQDGFINEDPLGGTDINRNFQHEYPYYADDAGRHMVSELESRAVMDWILKNRNVAIVLTFGESDNLIKAPTDKGLLSSDRRIDLFRFADSSFAKASRVGMMSSGGHDSYSREMSPDMHRQEDPQHPDRPENKPVITVNNPDLPYFQKISDKYRQLTGLLEQPPVRTPKGAFFQYAYYQYGVPSFSTPGWDIAWQDTADQQEEKCPSGNTNQTDHNIHESRRELSQGEGIDKKLLKWMDMEGVKGFMDWKVFDHPKLGQVEIGGFKPYETMNPPADRLAQLGIKHAEFVLYLSTLFAKIKIAKTEVTNHDGGVFRIKAEVENSGFLPTAMAHGVTCHSVKPTMVQLGVKSDRILSGNNKTNFFRMLSGSGKRKKYEWLIKGKAGDKIELKVVSQKAGSDKTIITLK